MPRVRDGESSCATIRYDSAHAIPGAEYQVVVALQASGLFPAERPRGPSTSRFSRPDLKSPFEAEVSKQYHFVFNLESRDH